MTPEEIEEFVHGRHTMAVATIGPDGWPHVVGMWYGFLDGAPAFETYAKSQKVRNLRRDPRISCLVESGEVYDELRGVELVGKAEIIEDTETVMEAARSVVRRYWPVSDADVDVLAENLARKRVAVRVDVERVVSWDHSKL